MQLFNHLVGILIAAAAGANALGCINGEGREPPASMNGNWQKAVAAMKKIVEDGTSDGASAIVGDIPPRRDEEVCMLSLSNGSVDTEIVRNYYRQAQRYMSCCSWNCLMLRRVSSNLANAPDSACAC